MPQTSRSVRGFSCWRSRRTLRMRDAVTDRFNIGNVSFVVCNCWHLKAELQTNPASESTSSNRRTPPKKQDISPKKNILTTKKIDMNLQNQKGQLKLCCHGNSQMGSRLFRHPHNSKIIIMHIDDTFQLNIWQPFIVLGQIFNKHHVVYKS